MRSWHPCLLNNKKGNSGSVEGDFPPPPDGGCTDSCKQGCKQGCNSGCKEIESDVYRDSREDSLNRGYLSKIDKDDPKSFATFSGSHGSPDPILSEEQLDQMHDRGISCDFGSVANEKIENGNVSKDRETSTVSKNLQAKSVCNHVCNPLCNTIYNCVATGTRPLPGLFDRGRSRR